MMRVSRELRSAVQRLWNPRVDASGALEGVNLAYDPGTKHSLENPAESNELGWIEVRSTWRPVAG